MKKLFWFIVIIYIIALGSEQSRHQSTENRGEQSSNPSVRQTQTDTLMQQRNSSISVTSSKCATMSRYSQLQTGMTYQQVIAILGCDGEEISSNEMAGFRTTMYQWQASGVTGLMGGNMNAMFQNGALISKAQAGLR